MIYRQAELRSDFRANLWHQLAALERSGIPVFQALSIMATESSQSFRPRVTRLLSLLRGGLPMSEAARRSGVWLPWEASVLAVAEYSGRRELFYQRFAQHYSNRASNTRKLKARLVYPYVVLIFAIVLGPLPSLARGDIDGLGYVLRTLLPLILLFVSQALLYAHYQQWRDGLQGMPKLLTRLAYFRRQQRRDYLALLALLLQAGVAAQDACKLLYQNFKTIDSLQLRLLRMQAALQRGLGVAEALVEADLLPDQQTAQLLASGEIAGRLDASFDVVINKQDQQLDDQLNHFAEWFPRLVYALMVGFIISQLL